MRHDVPDEDAAEVEAHVAHEAVLLATLKAALTSRRLTAGRQRSDTGNASSLLPGIAQHTPEIRWQINDERIGEPIRLPHERLGQRLGR